MTDTVAARELTLFATNDAGLYFNVAKPIMNNLAKKKRAGKYDALLARKAWQYLADEAARRYVREYGSKDESWFKMFPPSTRQLAIAEIMEHYSSELDDMAAAK